MKKKIGAWIIIILIGILLLGILFFTIDSYRIKHNKAPIFAVQYKIVNDGGTVIYLGLGYKIIDYKTINGNNKSYIGSYFMKYEDYLNEDIVTNLNNIQNQNEKYVPFTQLPKEYSFEQALKDGCFIISYKNIYNKQELDKFIKNTEINSKNRIPDTIRIIQYTVEGDMILTDIEYTKDNKYKITTDNTRDKFSTKEDRIITTKEDYSGEIYNITKTEDGEYNKIKLTVYKPSSESKDETICSYLKSANVYESGPTFLATVLQVEENLFFVKPEKEANLRR